jgi:hypothetical protein
VESAKPGWVSALVATMSLTGVVSVCVCRRAGLTSFRRGCCGGKAYIAVTLDESVGSGSEGDGAEGKGYKVDDHVEGALVRGVSGNGDHVVSACVGWVLQWRVSSDARCYKY